MYSVHSYDSISPYLPVSYKIHNQPILVCHMSIFTYLCMASTQLNVDWVLKENFSTALEIVNEHHLARGEKGEVKKCLTPF